MMILRKFKTESTDYFSSTMTISYLVSRSTDSVGIPISQISKLCVPIEVDGNKLEFVISHSLSVPNIFLFHFE